MHTSKELSIQCHPSCNISCAVHIMVHTMRWTLITAEVHICPPRSAIIAVACVPLAHYGPPMSSRISFHSGTGSCMHCFRTREREQAAVYLQHRGCVRWWMVAGLEHGKSCRIMFQDAARLTRRLAQYPWLAPQAATPSAQQRSGSSFPPAGPRPPPGWQGPRLCTLPPSNEDTHALSLPGTAGLDQA